MADDGTGTGKKEGVTYGQTDYYFNWQRIWKWWS